MRFGWTRTRLGDVADFVGGGTPAKSNPNFYGGAIPWITPKDMKSWTISASQITITQAGVDGSSTQIVPAGSVLVVVRSGILKHTLPVARTSVDVALNQDMKAIVAKSGVDSGYLARLIKAAEPTVLSWVRATTADNFPTSKLKQLELMLPPLDEQRRIAAVLDHVDALRAKRRESNMGMTELPESLFRSMFADSVDPLWRRMRVNDLLADGKSAIRTGPFGSQLLKDEFTESGIPVLGIDNVVTNAFQWGERRYISSSKYQQLKRYTVLPGDVLITIMGTNGRVAVVPDDIPTAINTKHICCITLDQNRCLPEYLRAVFLWHPESRRYLGATAKGAIMAGLNMGIIRDLPVIVPPIDLQRRFVSRVKKTEAARTHAEQHLGELDNLFASLQSRAFSGDLDVSRVVLPPS